MGSGGLARRTQDKEDSRQDNRRFDPQHNLEVRKTGEIYSQAPSQKTREPWKEIRLRERYYAELEFHGREEKRVPRCFKTS